MSDDDNSSITVDQPPPRNDHLERQNGVGRGRQMIPIAPNQRLRLAHRTLIIPNQRNIVKVLAAFYLVNRLQAMYILSGRGFVSQANLLSLPSQLQIACNGRREILYLSGWFNHMILLSRLAIPSSPHSGILHVSLSDNFQCVSLATSLIASGPVEVDVMMVCGPGSAIEPDGPGGPRVPIRIPVNVNGLVQFLQALNVPVAFIKSLNEV